MNNKKLLAASHVCRITSLRVVHEKQVTPDRHSKDTDKIRKLTHFGGIFPIMEQFDAILPYMIDITLELRCKSCGYSYNELVCSLMGVLQEVYGLQFRVAVIGDVIACAEKGLLPLAD